MKRFLIFTVLYPALGLLIFLASDPSSRNVNLLPLMLGDAYLAGIIPAWLSAAVDWKLSRSHLRLLGTAVTGAAVVMAGLVALHFGEILTGWVAVIMISLIGGVPAAVCSWLSGNAKGSYDA